MNKVQPLDSESSYNSSIDIKSSIDEEDSIAPLPHRKPFLSLKAFVIGSVISLVLLCSISVYLAVFIGLYYSNEQLTENVVFNLENEITNFLNKILNEMSVTARTAADHYNHGVSTMKDFRQYLYTPFKLSGLSVGYAFGNPSERYSYTIVGKAANPEIVYSYQPPGFIGTIRDTYTLQGELIKLNATVDYTPYDVKSKDYYDSTIEESERLGTDGAFVGIPYIVTNGSLSISYGAKVYDPVQYALEKKVLKGICRVVMPLSELVSYLSKVKVFKNGYVILSEFDADVAIAGSINTTTFDETSKMDLFAVEERNAGKLLEDLHSTYPEFVNVKKTMSITSLGKKYIVMYRTYEFENIKWRMFVVVFDEDVKLTTTISIILSVVCVLFIMSISVACAIGLTQILIRPIIYLRNQFQLIKVFDLKNVSPSNSMFKELDIIFTSLIETVNWLKEIKSFIPEHVFLQLQQVAAESQEKLTEQDKVEKSDEKQSNVGNSHISFNSSKQTSNFSDQDPKALFKIGLSQKECSVIHLILPDLFQLNHHEITLLFPKLLSCISPIAKVFSCDIQIVAVNEFRMVMEMKKSNKKPLKETAQECALKISRALDNMNKSQQQNQRYAIGISTCDSFVGNLGSKQMRFYSIISKASSIAKKLCFMAQHLKLKILIDESTLSVKQFLTRPVDRLQIDVAPNITTVFELIKENSVDVDDEWLYVLQNKNENAAIQSLHSILDVFTVEESTLDEKLSIVLEKLYKYLESLPNDLPSKHLIDICEQIQDHSDKSMAVQAITNYCCKVDTTIEPNISTRVAEYRNVQ